MKMDKLQKSFLATGSCMLLAIGTYGVNDYLGPISISVNFGDVENNETNKVSIEEKKKLELANPELNCDYIINNNSYIAELDSLINVRHSEANWNELTNETVKSSDRNEGIMQIKRLLHPETGVLIEYDSDWHFKEGSLTIDHKTYYVEKLDCPTGINKLVVDGYLTPEFKGEHLRLDKADVNFESYKFGPLIGSGYLIVDRETSRIRTLDPNLLD